MSGAIVSALETSHPQYELVQGIFYTLTWLENRPSELAAEAYGWCVMIWENHQGYEGWETLLLLSLEVGFRHIRPKNQYIPNITHAKHHQDFIDTVLRGDNSEAIADIALASYAIDDYRGLVASICANHIVDSCSGTARPPSLRLHKFLFQVIESNSFGTLEEMGQGRLVELLNHLQICIEDVTCPQIWNALLLGIIQSSEGALRLAIQPWELLAEVATSGVPQGLAAYGIPDSVAYTPDVTASLLGAEEWDKLECWMGVVWMLCPPEPGDIVEDLERAMTSLFRQRPGAVRKLTRWTERWSKECERDLPETFQQMCGRGRRDL